jgi:hypothetical protein
MTYTWLKVAFPIKMSTVRVSKINGIADSRHSLAGTAKRRENVMYMPLRSSYVGRRSRPGDSTLIVCRSFRLFPTHLLEPLRPYSLVQGIVTGP